MEAQLWKANWKRGANGFVLSLVDHPKIRASGLIWEEVVEQLEDLVADRLGDPVPHFEFTKPPPMEPAGTHCQFVHVLTGHKCADSLSNIEQLFVREKCPRCWNYSGPRTDALIELGSKPDGDLPFTEYLGQLISSRLAEYLMLRNSKEIVLRPVVLNGRETTDYLEVRSNYPREYVALKDVRADKGGFKCKVCQYVGWMYLPYEAPFFHYVREDCLPNSEVKIYPIGTDDRVSIVVSSRIRAAVIRSKQFKNVVSQRVGVIPAEQAAQISSFFD